MSKTAQDWTGVEDMRNNELGMDADECRALMGIPPLTTQGTASE